MARRLGDVGAHVLLVARREDALQAVAEEVRQRGGEAEVFVADLALAGAAAALVDRLGDAGEAVDVVINNAGFGRRGDLLDQDPMTVEAQVGLNVMAVTSLTRRLLPVMVARGRGGVLNVASISAFVPAPHLAVYAATKGYILSFTEAVHAELRGTGVHVSCLCPGRVATGFGERAGIDASFYARGSRVEDVAEAGLRGLAENTRRVVPGWWNKVQTAATRFVPTGPTLRVTGGIMRRAG